MTVAEARKVDATVDRSFEFYERVGVDAALMHHTPGHGIEQLRIPSYLSRPAWSYPPEVLEHRFGVKGIIYQWVNPDVRFTTGSVADADHTPYGRPDDPAYPGRYSSP